MSGLHKRLLKEILDFMEEVFGKKEEEEKDEEDEEDPPEIYH